jgi:hypothetical protein
MIHFSAIFLSLFSCTLDKQAIRQSDREQAMLREFAQNHWDGVRWGFNDKASAFVKDPKLRATYLDKLASTGARVRYIDAQVLHVEVGNENEEKEADWLREGTVFVRVEAYGISSVLEVSNIEQQWVRDPEGWWLHLSPDEF